MARAVSGAADSPAAASLGASGSIRASGVETDGTWRSAPTVPGWCAVPLRLYLGAAFLSAASNKIGSGKWGNWPDWMAGTIQTRLPEVPSFYQPILTGIILPHVHLFAPVVAVTEAVIGLALLLGAATRLAAVVGILLVLNYFLLDGVPAVGVSNDLAFAFGLLIVFQTRAGRSAGLDALLGQRWPQGAFW